MDTHNWENTALRLLATLGTNLTEVASIAGSVVG